MKPILECSGLSKQYTAGYYALKNLKNKAKKGKLMLDE